MNPFESYKYDRKICHLKDKYKTEDRKVPMKLRKDNKRMGRYQEEFP